MLLVLVKVFGKRTTDREMLLQEFYLVDLIVVSHHEAKIMAG